MIIKIDCKNRTDYMFTKFLDVLSGLSVNYLISCEHDGSSDRDVSRYMKKGGGVLTVANIVSPKQ